MPAALLEVLSTLKAHEAELRELGYASCRIRVGCQGEARPDSDIDVLVDLDPERPMGIFEYARLKLYMAGLLGRSGDVVNRKTLKPTRDGILRDMVNAF